jgi:LPXTG-motif cell wall-anchored protein
MKKLALTIAIVLGLGLGAFAQQGGGLFQYGSSSDGGDATYFGNRSPLMLNLPDHGETTSQPAPLGGGALLLIGFGAAYALKKRNEK